jgi:hypothetical protein
MTDSSSDPRDFDPVPSASNRHDGWTPERQREFIAALAKIGMVAAAARSVGMSRKSAYALLERAGPESGFARAWRAAAREGRSSAFSSAVDRAIHGVEKPYFYRGKLCGMKRVYDDRLLLAALRTLDREERRADRKRAAPARPCPPHRAFSPHVPAPSSPSSPSPGNSTRRFRLTRPRPGGRLGGS